MFAVVFVFVADGAFDGVFAWRRARSARGDTGRDDRDAVLVKEFVRTYMVVVVVMALIAYMAFTGKLLKPGGELPPHPYQGFATWQLWTIVVALFAVRAFVYWWDWVRGDEGALLPPAAVVSAPLRRLFVLQFGLLIVGLIVYWPLRSSTTGLVVLVLLAAAANVVLAVSERLRTARRRAALAAGEKPGAPSARRACRVSRAGRGAATTGRPRRGRAAAASADASSAAAAPHGSARPARFGLRVRAAHLPPFSVAGYDCAPAGGVTSIRRTQSLLHPRGCRS